jgi:hypothetical protein
MPPSVGFEKRDPGFVKVAAAPTHAIPEMFPHTLRHQKLRVLGPAIAAFGEAHFLLAKRLAMGRTGVMLMRGTVADMTVDNDEGRHVRRMAESFDRPRQLLRVVGVANPLHVPAIGQKARRDIVAEGEIRVPLDRHPVAVVEPAQIAKHLVPCERGRFARYAFHHVAVATQ